MDATGWAVIISAVFLGLTQLLQMVLSYLRDRDAARKVGEVKTALKATDDITTKRLEDVAAKVEIVHKATNSIKDELVAATDKAARAEGHAAGKLEGESEKKGA